MALVYKARLGCVYRKAVALKLADCADDDGQNIWPAVATIAAQAEVSERSVQNKLGELVALGLIEIVKRGVGAGHTTCYRFAMDALHDLALRRLAVDDTGETPRLAPVDNIAAGDPQQTVQPGAADDENPAPGAPLSASEKGAPRAPFQENPAPGAPLKVHATTEKGAPGAPNPSGTIQYPSTPPQPPAGGPRARDRLKSEIEQVIHSLRTADPQRGRVIDLLLAPVVGRLRLDAPSAQMALASLADWPRARAASDAVLRAAAAHLLETRGSTVKPSDVQAALMAEHVLAADQVWVERGSPEWDAWLAWHAATPGKRSLGRHIADCSRWAFPSRFPPADGSREGSRSAPTTEDHAA